MRLNYVLSGVTTGLRRNISMSIAIVLTTAISLALLGSGLILISKVNKMKTDFYYRVEVSIFLTEGVTQAQRDELRQQLQQDPLVKDVTYESKAEAYKRFRKQFQDSPDLINNTSPTALPESFRVKLKDPSKYALAADKYKSADGVDQVVDQRKILGPLFSIIGGIRLMAVAIAVVVLIAAVLLIGNTIQVAAFNRRREIEIMKLVGASNWYVQLPFVLEALVAGATGAALAIAMLVVGKLAFADRALAGLFRVAHVPRISYGDIFWPVAPQLLLIAAVLSALTAWVTLRFYVRL
ncbi:MAG: permease-like cell division protein FtsX [Pseudonocardiales bacterium]